MNTCRVRCTKDFAPELASGQPGSQTFTEGKEYFVEIADDDGYWYTHGDGGQFVFINSPREEHQAYFNEYFVMAEESTDYEAAYDRAMGIL